MINKKVETRSQAVVTQTYISPLPPASEAEKYEKLLKGSVDRIFTMAEEQQKKNYQRDFTLLANDELKIKKSYQVAMVAMAFAFTLCGISVAVGAWLVASGHEVWGTIFSAPCFIAILRYFLGSQKKS